MQYMQHLFARTPGQASRGARLIAARLFVAGCTWVLAACVSGTSGDTACKNTTLEAPMTGEIKGNVVVPRGATCHMKATIAGDVHVQDGAKIFVLNGTRITGSFRAIGAAQVRFNLDNGPAVASASNRPQGAPAARIVVGSNLIIKESRLVGESGIAATEIGGNLVIARNSDGGAGLDGKQARMNVCTPGMCPLDAAVKVGKSVKIKQNQIAVAMNNTSIGADLKCSSNDTAPVLMKMQADAGRVAVKGRKSGQCEHLREIVMAPSNGNGPAVASPAAPVTPSRPKA